MKRRRNFARLRARYAAADPEYRERLLARQRERRRQRYATDPVYREQFLERQRKRYATDLEYRQKIVTLRPQAGTPAQN
jgi:flagellum-specific peptidoglycan hydrolase FlgJ